MAKIFTSSNTELAAKALIHDILVTSGLHSNERTDQPFIQGYHGSLANQVQEACTKIGTELIERKFNGTEVDKALEVLNGFSFKSNFAANYKLTTIRPAFTAKAIVYMAEQLDLYWDDTTRTSFEIADFENTLLGAAVKKYGRYVSTATAKQAKASGRKSSSLTGTKRTGAPANNYKQTGPQSGNVRALLGNPGNKVFANGSKVYKIEGEGNTGRKPRAFIKPLSPKGATGNTNKVFVGTSAGYTDCVCFFDDLGEAQAFLDKILNSSTTALNGVSNLSVVATKPDANGYFLVDTEFGDCAISARQLNEAMNDQNPDDEVLTEETTEEVASDTWQEARENWTPEQRKQYDLMMRRD